MDTNESVYKSQLYSRQIGTLGETCMKQLSTCKVLLLQLDTTGFEIAKCLVLTGIQQIYLYDPRIPTSADIGLNIALQKNSIESIAEQTKNYLDKLNPFVTISVVSEYTSILDNRIIDVCIQTNLENSLQLSSFCHNHNIVYIFGYQYDLLGYIFNDFGSHTIHNSNGEKPLSAYVKTISKKKTILKIELEGQDMECSHIQFIIPPIEKIFSIQKDPIKNNTFYIEYDEHTEPIQLSTMPNILIQEYKPSSTIQHNTLQSYIDQRTYIPDAIGHTSSLYTPNECVELFHTHIYEQSNSVVQLSNSPTKEPMCLPINSIHADNKFPIIGSIIGSIIAQEVIKTTGMYTPINQQYVIDYSDIRSHTPLSISKTYSLDDPYYHIRTILPEYVLETLRNLRVFLVGCGALGCEYLKYFHQLHMSSHSNSSITVTDMDHIELSNLNRQFLFRENNIGQSKSHTATQSIQKIHAHTDSDMYIKALDKELSERSNEYFNYTFWESNDIIVNALDNIKTRQFVDEKCVIHNKPLFESGTLGTKCNVQVIIPHTTITYSETQDPPQKEIPVCTIKHFPYMIDHCISWALDIFHYHFTVVTNALDKVCNTDTYITTFNNMSNINNKYQLLVHTTYLFYVVHARKRMQQPMMIKYLVCLFHTYYNRSIQLLQDKHPKDSLHEDGSLFWSGHKLYPSVVRIDSNKRDIYQWVETMYDVYTHSMPDIDNSPFTEKTYKSIDGYLHALQSTNMVVEELLFKHVHTFYSQHNIKQSYTSTKEYISTPVEIKINILYDYIYSHTHNGKKRKYKKHVQPPTRIQSQTFDKDHLTNKHIDMISYMSNYRATTYGIQTVSIPECRMIAGNIIPALSTTTTLVTALSVMEMLIYIYNMYQPKDTTDTDDTRQAPKITHSDHFINTGVNTYIQSEPMEPTIIQSGFNSRYGCNVVAKPNNFSIWDKILIHTEKNNVKSIYDIIQLLDHTYTIHVSMLSINNTIVYTNDMDIQTCTELLLDVYPKHEYIQLDITDFEGDALVVYPNIVLYCE